MTAYARPRPSTISRRLFLPLMAVLLLILAACGGDGDAGGDAATGGETPAAGGGETADEDAAGEEEAEGEPYYAGKQIEVIVPFGPGGGTDTQGRFLAEYLAEYIEGGPTVQVVNIEGGSGALGSNEFALQRPPDGTSILFSSGSSTLPWLLGQSGIEYDYREMVPILGIPAGAVVYVHSDTGVESIQDLRNPAQPLVIAEQTPTSLGALFLILWDLLELDVQTVFGYEGRGPARIALEQGEANLDWQTLSAYRANVEPLIEQGTAVPLFTPGQLEGGDVVPDPAFPDMPTAKDVYMELNNGEEPSGELWDAYKVLLSAGFTLQKVMWVHDETPEAAVQALRDAAVAMTEDPEFQEQAPEILEYDMIVGDALDPAVDDLLSTDQSVLDFVANYLVENYDAQIE